MENNSKEKEKGLNKKTYIYIIVLIVCIIILLLISISIYKSFNKKTSFENTSLNFAKNNEETIFSIDKCTFFSGVDTKNKASSISNFTIENLYQYTDMAFFINNHNTENNMENTLKSVSISNIQYTKSPKLGEPSIYYKNFNNFTKSEIEESNKIEDYLNFEVSSEDTLDFDTPSIYNNCASPIVLSYVNSNIKTDYTFTDTSTPITYDGTLLNRLNINLSLLECSISFDVYITNNLDQQFKTTVNLDIPLQSKDDNSSIYDGKYLYKVDTNYIFYRYQ